MERDKSSQNARVSAEQIDRYLAGGHDAAECAEVEAYLAAHPRAERFHQSLRRHLLPVEPHHAAEAAYARLEQRIEGEGRGKRLEGRRDERRWAVRVWGGFAAAAVLLVGLGVTAHMRATPGVPGVASNPSAARYSTQVGQLATVTLADGSRVTLAPQSVLEVAPEFGTSSRTVTLNGEAYFEVGRSRGIPFVVTTGQSRTQVLGTVFTVRRYATDMTTHVAVVAGKVSVTAMRRASSTATLVRGDAVNATDSIVVRANESAQDATWMTGRLVFRDAPASDVLATLSRWYGFQFRCTDSSLGSVKLNASMSTRSSAAALKTLKLVLGVNLTFDGSIVTLHPIRETRSPQERLRNQQDDIVTHTNEVGR
jgi:transmembrane sensor